MCWRRGLRTTRYRTSTSMLPITWVVLKSFASGSSQFDDKMQWLDAFNHFYIVFSLFFWNGQKLSQRRPIGQAIYKLDCFG